MSGSGNKSQFETGGMDALVGRGGRVRGCIGLSITKIKKFLDRPLCFLCLTFSRDMHTQQREKFNLFRTPKNVPLFK